MKQFFSFRHNRNIVITDSALVFKNFIDEFTISNGIKNHIENLSRKYNIPPEIITHEYRFYLATTFCFQTAKFNDKYKIKNLLNYLLKSVGFILYSLLFSQRYQTKKNVDLLALGVEAASELKRLDPILKRFPNHHLITTFDSNNSENATNLSGFKKREFNISLKILFSEFFLLPKMVFLSFFYQYNFLCFHLYFLNKLSYFKTIYSIVAPKFTFQERHYDTSAIQSYLHRHNGGIASTAIQKNIIQIGYPCFYHYTDVMFALSSDNYNLALRYGANVHNIIPVGSYFMESSYYKDNYNYEEIEEYDILCIGGNSHPDHTLFLNTYESYWPDYYEHFKWHVTFAEKHPNLKVAIKHRTNTKKDPYEYEILKNSLIHRANPHQNSYAMSFKAKVVTTWCSTMGYELIAHGKDTIFADPGKRNLGFLPNTDILDTWRATSYKEFEEMLLACLNKANHTPNFTKNILCERSDNVTDKISDYLKTYKD